MYWAPCARLMKCITPNTSVRPAATRNKRTPSCSPLRIWTARSVVDMGDPRRGRSLGALLLPFWGEGWGEGVQSLWKNHNPSPHPSPYGRGSRSSARVGLYPEVGGPHFIGQSLACVSA